MSRVTANQLEKGRITARVPFNVQETIQRAAELTGVPVNAYVVQVVHQHAVDVIDRHEMKTLALSAGDAAWFLAQLAKPRSPNVLLRQALNHSEGLMDEDQGAGTGGAVEGDAGGAPGV